MLDSLHCFKAQLLSPQKPGLRDVGVTDRHDQTQSAAEAENTAIAKRMQRGKRCYGGGSVRGKAEAPDNGAVIEGSVHC